MTNSPEMPRELHSFDIWTAATLNVIAASEEEARALVEPFVGQRTHSLTEIEAASHTVLDTETYVTLSPAQTAYGFADASRLIPATPPGLIDAISWMVREALTIAEDGFSGYAREDAQDVFRDLSTVVAFLKDSGGGTGLEFEETLAEMARERPEATVWQEVPDFEALARDHGWTYYPDEQHLKERWERPAVPADEHKGSIVAARGVVMVNRARDAVEHDDLWPAPQTHSPQA